MRVTIDHKAEAAYIYLVPIKKGGVRRTIPAGANKINLDFDVKGTLVGIELLDLRLLNDVLREGAQDITDRGGRWALPQ